MQYVVVSASLVHANDGPLIELNRLAGLGYHVIGSAIAHSEGSYCFTWTMEKDSASVSNTMERAKTSYLIISTILYEINRTYIGDKHADVALMETLNAELETHLTSPDVYVVKAGPQDILNILAGIGYRVIATTGNGKRIVWTLEKKTEGTVENQ